jgi:NADH:ubiquinone oxidoreductase subunit K
MGTRDFQAGPSRIGRKLARWRRRVKNETLVGAIMVFLGIVIMLVALTLGVVLPSATLRQVQSNVFLVGVFLTPPFFTVGGMVLIILGKMHSESETRKTMSNIEGSTP